MDHYVREIDVALAAAGRTRALWARTYLDLELAPEHRQTEELRCRLIDEVCSQRMAAFSGDAADNSLFLSRVPLPVAMGEAYQSTLRDAMDAGRTIVGGIYVRGEFVAEIPVVSPEHYELIDAWTLPPVAFQKPGISAAEQSELNLAVKAFPGWVLGGYGVNKRACNQLCPEICWPYSSSKATHLRIDGSIIDADPNAFEPLGTTIREALRDPMEPPADGFYEPRLDSSFFSDEVRAKTELVHAVLGPRTFEEVCAGGRYRTPSGASANAPEQRLIEKIATQRDKQLVRTGETIISKQREEKVPLLIVGVSTLPLSSSQSAPNGDKQWLGAATLVHLSFLKPTTGETQTLTGFEAATDEAARSAVRAKFFPTARTDALVLAETRQASKHAVGAFKAMFPGSFLAVVGPLTGKDRVIIDPVASLEDNDVPAFIQALGFTEPWPGKSGDFSGISLDALEGNMFTPLSAKRSLWLARACAWYHDLEEGLVNAADSGSPKKLYVTMEKGVPRVEIPGAPAQMEDSFALTGEHPVKKARLRGAKKRKQSAQAVNTGELL